jgi:putative heme-binding domain-containing protein
VSEMKDRAALLRMADANRGKEENLFLNLYCNSPTMYVPEEWGEFLASLLFQLHAKQTIPAFQTRALSPALPLKARLDALTAIGFNDTKEAAAAMLEVAVKSNETAPAPQRGGTTKPGASEERAQPREPAPQTTEPQRGETPSTDTARVRETALWWLLNRKDSTWKDHNLNAALKQRGLYDPDKITLLPAPLPPAVAPPFSTADAAKLTGDAKRGEAVAAKCFLCHKIGDQGVDYGPDLSSFGRTQTTEALLRSIIEPDADIAHGFAGTRIETQDGLIIEGLLLSESDPLIIRSAGGVTQMVPAARVKSKTALQGRSLMMSAAQLGLTAQEAADVAAYLRGR